jgi:uncharacterized repeat protein (TIGR01451 family)
MLRIRRPRGVVAAVVGALSVSGLVAASLPGCGDGPPGAIQCLESISPSTASVAAGSTVVFTVSVANPDDDDATAVVVVWTISGGGTLDQSETTLTLVDQSDPYGNPLGTNGTTPNTFNAVGPAGAYTLQASVLAGGGCLAQTLPVVPIQVTGTLPVDAGAPDASSDAGGDDAADGE